MRAHAGERVRVRGAKFRRCSRRRKRVFEKDDERRRAFGNSGGGAHPRSDIRGGCGGRAESDVLYVFICNARPRPHVVQPTNHGGRQQRRDKNDAGCAADSAGVRGERDGERPRNPRKCRCPECAGEHAEPLPTPYPPAWAPIRI